MNRQETVQKIFDRQKWVGNSSISKNDIALLLEELNRKSIHLLRRKDMLVRQKTKVDNDLKQTEEEIKCTTARLENIIHDDKQVSISMKKQKSKRYIKGRFWWEGKQRDVQIGSEKTILFLLKNLKKSQIVKGLKIKNGKKINWKIIQADKKLNEAVQTIGRIKATGYILKKVKGEDILHNQSSEVEDPKKNNKNIIIKTSPIVKTNEHINIDWYTEWKDENF
ncbi:uncharacterized protein METZ01_LOCUS188692 [marine metagenome]|uniref:Uncharacterized protein n=1 Tax=marine metagenome TaxID=408172 RepID=A0A382DBP0_9ZZZZ|tara:strand:- start:22 stop:690 length:669 start_codon:yes stop_codon:yes gene_type:complete